MRDIIGAGGKSGGGAHTHYEAPDSLLNTSYARVLDLVSEGEILGLAKGLQSIYLNNTPVENADGSKNFENVTVDFRTGMQDQDYIPGFPDVESETAIGVELKFGTPWVHAFTNTELSAVRVTLGVAQLYQTDTTNGDISGYQVDYQIELSTDGGAFNVVQSASFNGKTMNGYQRTARIDLPRAVIGWQLRVTRLTANSTLASIADKTTMVSYAEVIDAKLRYPMSAIVGIQIDAKAFQSVPTRAFDLLGRIIQVPTNYDPIARTYSGVWDGTFKPAWTNNPAWIFRDLALNDRFGLGHRITPAQIDKWALYKIARYCDELVPDGKGGMEPRFSCNVYLQSRKAAYAVLQDLASVFRGITYWGGGTIMAVGDMPSDPVYVYTAANVVDGKFNRPGSSKKTRYTVALVSWSDPDDFCKPKVEYVEDPEGIARYGIQQVELTAFGCTSQGQAQRVGRWALATSRLETGMISFDVGLDGAIALPGQIVRVADPARMGRRVGGRIRSSGVRSVVLDKAPAIRAGDRLTVILPAGASETRTVVGVAVDAITVDADWSALPVAQSVWSVDSDELSAPLFRVLSVTEKDEVTFTISATQHESGKFEFVENGVAITPRPQTVLDVTTQAPPASVTVSAYTVSLNDVQKLVLSVACAPVPGAVAYQGAYRRGNDNWVPLVRQAEPTLEVSDVLAGTYVAKMAAVNSIGVVSVETVSVAVEIAKDGNSKNAAVLLSADGPGFHTNAAGVTTPDGVAFTATLIALDGPVTFSAEGGTLTDVTDTGATLTFANMSAAAATVKASVTAFGRTYSSNNVRVTKMQDGAAGVDGLKTATARLYQWSPIAPAKPNGASTFIWAGLANDSYSGSDGWTVSVPTNPGTPLMRLYVASVALSAAAAESTSPVSYTGATVEAWSQNGANGANGVQAASATVYQWAATIPAGPAGSATFTWAGRTFGTAPAGWTLTPGASPAPGMTLWVAAAEITDTATNATTAFNWSIAAVMAIGYAGSNGQAGASYVTAYCASETVNATSAPAPTTGRDSLPADHSGGIVGTWSASVPTLADGQIQYQVDGNYDPATNKITWSKPYWSSLKVATISAISANLGMITGGSINLGGGTFTVDNDGNLVCHSIMIMNPDGSVMLQAGGQLNPANAAPGTKNSDVSISSTGLLQGAGGGQVQMLPVKDGARTVNYTPQDYGVVHVKEFKLCSAIGIATTAAHYCVLETNKPWIDNSGGNATQWAYVSASEIWKRSGGCGDAAWGAWVRDLDRSTYTGDLDATKGADWYSNVANRPSDSDIKSNLIDLSWWKRGAAIPWTQNYEYNAITSTGEVGVVGPRGSADDMWYAKEVNGDSAAGGGWESPYFSLDINRTYRFVVPIYRISGTGESYWGTHNVCDLNTTTANGNPYFASTGGTALLPGRWYLFVGFIFPAGSTNHTNDGAGVWDCSTGQQVRGGNNWCFDASLVSIHHRAYQYYATNGAEQLFGRPMINVVDGTEPSLREYFAPGALMNSSITLGADGTLSGGGGGQVTLPGMGQHNFRVVSTGGSGVNAPLGASLWKDGVQAYGGTRSYNVAIIRRSDGALIEYQWFDVYGEGAIGGGGTAANMAGMLNYYGPDCIAVVWGMDEPQAHRLDSGLDAAMYRCGASRAIYGSSEFKRCAGYILVGICGCGEGNGIEAYQGSVDNDPNAWCDVAFTLYKGSITGMSGTYTPTSLRDYGYVGDLDATAGAPAGTYVGGTLAENVEANAANAKSAAAAAQAAADAANSELSNIASDNILSKGEKPAANQDWTVIYNERGGIQTQAASLGVDATNYINKFNALQSYLVSLGAGFTDYSIDTAIDGPTFQAKFSDYYTAKQSLLNAIAAAAATKAQWSGVGGSGKPEDNANFIPPSKGNCINVDPGLEKQSNWQLDGGAYFRSGAGGNAVGPNYINVIDGVSRDVRIYDKTSYAVDPNATYSLTANLFADFGNDRNMYIFVNFWDVNGAQVGTGWGGSMSGYTFGGLPSTGNWYRQGGQFGAGTGRAIPVTARTVSIGVWFRYSGNGSSFVEQGFQDLRLEKVVSQSMIDPAFAANIASKLQKDSDDTISGKISLTSPYALLVGTANDGIFYGSTGIYGRKGGYTTFSIGADGTATFAGTLLATNGSFGTMTIAAGGSLSSGQSNFDTGTGFWLGYTGGVPKFSLGVAGGAGLRWDGSSLTIRDPAIVKSTPFAVNAISNATYSFPRSTASRYVGSYTASAVGNSGAVNFTFTLNNTAMNGATAYLTQLSATACAVYCTCNYVGNIDLYVTVSATDASGASAKPTTFNINVDFT